MAELQHLYPYPLSDALPCCHTLEAWFVPRSYLAGSQVTSATRMSDMCLKRDQECLMLTSLPNLASNQDPPGYVNNSV